VRLENAPAYSWQTAEDCCFSALLLPEVHGGANIPYGVPMRIIGDQRDYYDCVQSVAQDRSILYVRRPEEDKQFEWPFPYIFTSHWGGHTVDVMVVGFCGKIYPLLKITKNVVAGQPHFCYSLADVDKLVDAELPAKIQKTYYGRGLAKWRRGTRKTFGQFFDECQRKQNDFSEMFDNHPVFVAKFWTKRKSRIHYDCLLNAYNFERVFDPYTAFQDLSMYMGNKAQPEKVMPVIPDDLKIHSRGFDKWSFRRPPAGE